MSTANKIQHLIHRLEEGGWAVWIRRILLASAILYVASAWMFKESGFRGLGHEKAMDQAQIAREIARGNGFATQFLRPAALGQFQSNLGSIPKGPIPDTFHVPLNPWINSWFLRLTSSTWTMSTADVVYLSDKVLASVQLLFYLLAVLTSYFTLRRLFDERLALLASGLLLLCETFWDFSMAGLPQMLLLLLFSLAVHAMTRLLEERQATRGTLRWSTLLGILFGLLSLTHPLALFLFAGALLWSLAFLRPWGRDAAALLAAWALVFSPWLARNHTVCGNPLGIIWHPALAEIRGSESQILRSSHLEQALEGVTPRTFLLKVRTQVIAQFGGIYGLLGGILVAPAFFIALLHAFRRPETALLRWWILTLWLFAVLGMGVAGLEPHRPGIHPMHVKANDLHVLFIPVMTAYGLAFVLVLWTRLELASPLLRRGFLALLYFVSALPFLSQLLELHRAQPLRVHWPPYVPPYISLIGRWMEPNEIVLSDMPWAVAWYADRRSLWLPLTRNEYLSLHTFNSLGGPINGLYLTPLTGNRPFWSEIGRGEFAEWAPFVLHQADVGSFPLRVSTAMPMNDECVFYTDKPRWNTASP